MKTALVLGAGGFIGSHMVKRLKAEGYWVRGVDLKYPEFQDSSADEFIIADLRDPKWVDAVMRLSYLYEDSRSPISFSFNIPAFTVNKPFDVVVQLAADMGGAQYVFSGNHDADIMSNSAIININVCETAKKYGVGVLFYSSSACMYPQGPQNPLDPDKYYDETMRIHEENYKYGLSEDMAYPADPDSEYGWEKLFSERMYLAYARNHGLNIRIARFHNIYGPLGTYKGGKEKAPAAICRKTIESSDKIEIIGDGEQTRSFLYIDDCIDAVRLLMESDFKEPINIGSEEMVSINELAKLAMFIGNKDLEIVHIEGPTGVRGRNSNNELIRKVLNWEPKFTLAEGLANTYHWIHKQINNGK
jgi:GDP-D-mannose 3',5'-epimerase